MKKHENVLVLRQSNKISRAATVPSLRQGKIYRYLIMRAKENLLSQEWHTISQEELKDFLGSNDWENLREDVERLQDIKIRWDLLPQKDENLIWGTSPLLADCELVLDENGRRIFRYSFSPKMRRELARPRFYRDIDLSLIREFRSSYSLKFYEYCLSAINPGQKEVTTQWIPEEIFREILSVPEGSYKSYRDFERRICSQAVKEVNEFTDLCISVHRRKLAPKKYEFCFHVTRQKAQLHLRLDGSSLEDEAFRRFMEAHDLLKQQIERDFFKENPHLKKEYARGKRNKFFEAWMVKKYNLEEAVENKNSDNT